MWSSTPAVSTAVGPEPAPDPEEEEAAAPEEDEFEEREGELTGFTKCEDQSSSLDLPAHSTRLKSRTSVSFNARLHRSMSNLTLFKSTRIRRKRMRKEGALQEEGVESCNK